MAKRFLRVRRDEAMLLPPDVRDWLPGDHVVWFLIDAVAAMDTSVVRRRARLGGAGRAGYDPEMMLTLLIYAYAGGVRSSRAIERRCREDVAFMVVSGLSYPDHATIARFRADHDAAMADLFAQVLALCGRAGMGALEHVAIDGTKMAADASPSQSRDVDGLRKTAWRLIEEAAGVDADEDARHGDGRGDELPPQLADPRQRRAFIDKLIAEAAADADAGRGKRRAAKAGKADRVLRLVDDLGAEAGGEAASRRRELAERVARSEAHLTRIRDDAAARYRARNDREAALAAQARTLPGTRPVPPADQAHVRRAADRAARARKRLADHDATGHTTAGKRNITDPDATFMPVSGGSYVLGYNSQLAVSADHLILAADVVTTPSDVTQLAPMLAHLAAAVDTLRQATGDRDLSVGVALFDAGYNSDANLTTHGPDRLIAQGKRHHVAGDDPPTSPPPDTATPRQKMAWTLSTDTGKALYRKRAATVEPVNAHLKDQRGLRRFARRGLAAAKAELHLAALTTNLLRLRTQTT